MSDSAISIHNLLSKLCFVQFGGGLAEHKDAFLEALLHALKRVESPPITPQAIRHWFSDSKAVPKRAEALRFLELYFMGSFKKSDALSEEQKKVFDQLRYFFRRVDATGSSPRSKLRPRIGLSPTKRVVIDLPQTEKEMQQISAALVGCYFVYHVRIVEDQKSPIAREFIQVYRTQHEVRFILWDQLDRGSNSEFRGTVIQVGNLIWFIGTSSLPKERLRIMAFRDVSRGEHLYSDVQWGIMAGDIPRPSTNDPAACRVLLWKSKSQLKSTVEAAIYAKNHVRNISYEECGSLPLSAIYRLVSNNNSAMSKPMSIEPMQVFGTITDSVLKTSQETLERACEVLNNLDPDFI